MTADHFDVFEVCDRCDEWGDVKGSPFCSACLEVMADNSAQTLDWPVESYDLHRDLDMGI